MSEQELMRSFFKPGDVIDLGGGITWRLSEALAMDLNRDRCRQQRRFRRREYFA